VDVATVTLGRGERRVFLHIMLPRDSRSPRRTDLLTGRQLEILRLLAEGVPAKVVAIRLNLAEATVRNHIRAILVALGTHSQLEAIAQARRLQLVD
jgi:two-component system nitrate/nitrite response regulator NarL